MIGKNKYNIFYVLEVYIFNNLKCKFSIIVPGCQI